MAVETVLICLALAALAPLPFILPQILRVRRIKKLMSTPTPKEWDSLFEANVPLYEIMPKELRERLKSCATAFLAEKRFEACGGLELDDEMKLIIAAQACTLLLGRENPSFFPALDTILVYPGAFYSQDRISMEGQWIDEDDAEKLGESWHSGSLILSWEHVKREGNMQNDGLNVVLHEFAHQLDEECGFADGAPSLEGSGLSYREWSQVMSREYASLLRDIRRGRRGPIDEYGASSPAEFFAVVTETFFEKPIQLKRRNPELYEEFRKLYKLDPAAWREAAFAAAPPSFGEPEWRNDGELTE